jgi:hypothetical protein
MSQNQQNTGTYEESGRMSTPPNVITTKDLSYLKDAMSWELLAMKKCSHYATYCQDNEIKSEIDRCGQMHQKHYDQLLQYLQAGPVQNLLQ